MTRSYYTLCVWDAEQQTWFDECGDYSKADVELDAETFDVPKRYKVIIKTDGSSAAMIARRDALPDPK